MIYAVLINLMKVQKPLLPQEDELKVLKANNLNQVQE
jgi:hypothetical protein